MYFDDLKIGMTVDTAPATIEAYNQKGELVLTDVTEAIVKCRMQ
jgi:hypothetical protein